ncbi:MAG TPA: hypothetical protein VIJ86_10390 [Acidimicrobiales bacterium]
MISDAARGLRKISNIVKRKAKMIRQLTRTPLRERASAMINEAKQILGDYFKISKVVVAASLIQSKCGIGLPGDFRSGSPFVVKTLDLVMERQDRCDSVIAQ